MVSSMNSMVGQTHLGIKDSIAMMDWNQEAVGPQQGQAPGTGYEPAIQGNQRRGGSVMASFLGRSPAPTEPMNQMYVI
jgi:hypothetical protein